MTPGSERTRGAASDSLAGRRLDGREMRSGARPWLAAALWVALAAAAAAMWRLSADQPVSALPLEVRGNVRVSPPGGGTDQEVRAGVPLPAGCRVRVPAGASVTLSLVPGIVARADEPAEFSLTRLMVGKSDTVMESRLAEVAVRSGRVRFAVILPEDGKAGLRVTTPEGGVTAEPGSFFSVDASLGKTRVVCSWGGVIREPGGDPVRSGLLLRGEFCDTAPGSAADNKTRNALEDAAAQEELAELVRSNGLINSLEEAQIVRSAPFLARAAQQN